MTQELRKLAEAATVGVWKASGFSVNSKEHGWATIANTELDYDGMAENAAYIAAANPAAILELLDRLEKAEKDAARLLPLLKQALSVVDGSYSEEYDQGFEGLVSAALFTEIQAMEANK